MHTHLPGSWEHEHVFLSAQHLQNERKTWFVIVLTTGMMFAEIIGGEVFGSMALKADGWHMLTHALALGISAFAYTYARWHKSDTRFSFGTGKLGDLAAFTSAIILGLIALVIGYQSLNRMITPLPIEFSEALPIAIAGLTVNIISAALLHDHSHHHHHNPGEKNHHHDNNLRSAYGHVVADAATSLLAIVGLSLGWIYKWLWVDAVMGLIGAVVIASWSYSLIRSAGRVLIDITSDRQLSDNIRKKLEIDNDLVTDLHVWQIGIGHHSAIISILTDNPQSPLFYKQRLVEFTSLSHITIEVHPCPDA